MLQDWKDFSDLSNYWKKILINFLITLEKIAKIV